MNPPEPEHVRLKMPNVPIKPEQVKGSDGVYLTFKGDSVTESSMKDDPVVRFMLRALAITIYGSIIGALVAGVVKLIMWMF